MSNRGKVAKKDTWVDMTAFVDVAFLLLAFFVLTTNFKPSEAVQVITPNSVSSKTVPEIDQVLFTINEQGKLYLSFSEPERREAVVEDLNKRLNLQLTPQLIKDAGSAEYFATPLTQMKSFLEIPADKRVGSQMPGIPIRDSTDTDVREWLASIQNVFYGSKMNLMVKGDQKVQYPKFKFLIDAFKKQDMMKFQVVTNQMPPPKGSALEKKIFSGQKVGEGNEDIKY